VGLVRRLGARVPPTAGRELILSRKFADAKGRVAGILKGTLARTPGPPGGRRVAVGRRGSRGGGRRWWRSRTGTTRPTRRVGPAEAAAVGRGSPAGRAARRLEDLARLRRVRDRIDREYARPLGVEELARGAHISAGHLSREFRRAYGEPPHAYLMTRRIERAMALLRRGDLVVTEAVLRGGLLVARHLQRPLRGAGGRAAERLPAPGGARDCGDASVRGQTGDQTGQGSRSEGTGPQLA
jgi:AraC-like DNA-binding protein